MARSQNGWTVLDSPPIATTPYITGRVRPGDVDVIFTYLGKRFDAEVERIRKDWSWGWAKRNVRGSTSTISNHASATAQDFNAPAHVLGKRGTFSSKQAERIRAILRDLDGVIRWGGDFKNRADEMHFEIITNAASVKRVADKIRNGTLTRPATPAWKPNPKVKSDLDIIQQQFQIVAGLREGKIARYNGIGLIQKALGITIDGYCGEKTMNAWAAYERKKGGTGRTTTPDMKSLKALGLDGNFVGPQATDPAPAKPPAKVKVRLGIHNVYVKRKVAEVNQTYAALLAKHPLHAVLLQETAQMYGKWNIPGYKVIQFAPKRLHDGHVIETSSNTILVRDDAAVEFRDLLDLTETWKGPKLGAMHDPRAPLAARISVQGKDLDLLDVHGPFGRDAVAEFNAAVAAWLKASRNPAVAGGDYNQKFATVATKIGTPSGALVDGQDPDMVATKGPKKTDSENLGKQGSDTHFFKIFEYEI